MAVATNLGRVQPLFKGNYDPNAIYYKLDNVYYNDETWVCQSVNGVRGIPPASGQSWQKVAGKGNTGSFGTPVAEAFELPYGQDPSVNISATGPDTEKVFSFTFGIPAGPIGETGVQSAVASATQRKQDDSGDLQAGDPPWVTVTLDSSSQELSMRFGIPPGHDGEGSVSTVDGLEPTGGNVALGAISYNRSQALSSEAKAIGRANINAMANPSASTNQYLYYNSEGQWVGKTINEVPTGGASDVNKYLRKIAGGMTWSDVQSLPSGGLEGAPLIKYSNTNYDVTWGAIISTSEIDAIVNA